MDRQVFRGLSFLVLLLAVPGCGRDFALPTSDFAIQGATVTPRVTRQGVALELEVRTVGPAPSAISARILGTSFVDGGRQAEGPWSLSYEPQGTEPEGVEVRIDIEATSEEGTVTAVAWGKFDFTAPTLVQVLPAKRLIEADGERVEVDFVFDEELAGAPTISVGGGALSCAQATREEWRCTVTAAAGDPAGWLSASVAAEDLAGNTLTTSAELGLAIDRSAAPAALILTLVSQEPSPATSNQDVVLVIESNLPLSAAPAVGAAGRTLECEAEDPAGRHHRCTFVPQRADLGTLGGEGPVPLVADATSLRGESGHLDAEVILDLLGPQVTGMTATRPRVLADQALTLFVAFHEPVAAAEFTLQGRELSCTYSAPDAAVCNYQATGNELPGPQRLRIIALDALGNESIQQVDAPVVFDFSCDQLSSRAFVTNSTVRPTSFFAEPGVFEPGSSVALALVEGTVPFLTLTADASGAVSETPLPPMVERFVWFQATDIDGHACPWARSSQRFTSEFSPTEDPPSANMAVSLSPGIRSMSLPAYLVDRGSGAGPEPFSPAQLVPLAVEDGSTFMITEPALPPVEWTNHGSLVGAPGSVYSGPLVWDPTQRKVIRYWTTVSNARIEGWDGAAWSYEAYFNPAPGQHLWGWGATHSLSTSYAYYYGGVDAGGPLDDLIRYDGFDYQRPISDPRPTGRAFPCLSYQESRRQLLLFGGSEYDQFGNPEVNGETWAWNGFLWARLDPSEQPSERFAASMVNDVVRGPVYLFGGDDRSTTFDDTWVFDGFTWREATPAIRPPARWHAGSTYHGGMEKMLVFGGWDLNDQELGDLWGFDGTEWSDEGIAGGPPPVAQPGVAYDFLRGALVVYGGYLASGQTMQDLWELSPTARYPQTLFQLQMPAFVESTSVAVLSITGRGTAIRPGGNELGLEIDLWDEATNRWWPLPMSVGSTAANGMKTYVISMNEEILSRQQAPWAFVLVRTRGAATPEGGATLEIDSISMQIDTF